MKKSEFIILFFLLLVTCYLIPVTSFANLVNDLQEQIQQKQDEIKQLEEQAAAYKKELETAQVQKNTLKNQLANIEARIKKLQNDISLTAARISATTLKIEELSLDISEKENEIDKKKSEISSLLQVLAEYDHESILETILTKQSLSEFVSQVRYLETLQDNVFQNMTELQNMKRNLEQEKDSVTAQKNQLTTLNNQLRGQKQVVDQEKQEKNYLLIQTKGQEKQYQALLNETLKKQQEIEQEIYDLEYKLKQTLDPSALPTARPGVLSWPLDGILTQTYGYTASSKKLYKSGFHNGIDISSAYGESILAARDGKVIGIGSCGRYAYGKWIALEHENGLITLYGHLSSYGAFKVGDSVQRGEIIGYEGNTGYSTGAHLHFGVYVSATFKIQSMWYGLLPLGAHLDPMKYL
jgi:murein DD-endopeptidase MepM/ murein hydrolase activator NlpD